MSPTCSIRTFSRYVSSAAARSRPRAKFLMVGRKDGRKDIKVRNEGRKEGQTDGRKGLKVRKEESKDTKVSKEGGKEVRKDGGVP
jgi:hypothetical protein